MENLTPKCYANLSAADSCQVFCAGKQENVLNGEFLDFSFLIFFLTFLSVTLCRCTIQKECAQELLQRSWISMGEGPQQCPSMTLTPPEISISADIKVVLIPSISLLSITPVLTTTQIDITFHPL